MSTCWTERRHGMKSSGGAIEAAHTKPGYRFLHTPAQLADAVEANI